MTEKIPFLGTPNTREINRIVDDLERRVLIIGRDQRTVSGIENIKARAYFMVGCLSVLILLLIGAR